MRGMPVVRKSKIYMALLSEIVPSESLKNNNWEFEVGGIKWHSGVKDYLNLDHLSGL